MISGHPARLSGSHSRDKPSSLNMYHPFLLLKRRVARFFQIETKESLREQIADLALQLMAETKCREEAVAIERRIAKKEGHQQAWNLTKAALAQMGMMQMIEPIQQQMQEIIHAANREREIAGE